MIKLTILYPNEEGKKFDKDYYINTHMPLTIKLQGDAIKKTEVEFGISGGMPGSKPSHVAICNFWYESFEAFQQAFTPHAETIVNDVKNYTDIETVLQFSEMMLSL